MAEAKAIAADSDVLDYDMCARLVPILDYDKVRHLYERIANEARCSNDYLAPAQKAFDLRAYLEIFEYLPGEYQYLPRHLIPSTQCADCEVVSAESVEKRSLRDIYLRSTPKTDKSMTVEPWISCI